ncbi:MAG: PCRF domain-containing protein, partial [Chloroflexi bacterium]|nr:PCRF domain-containing protein [Chloroflexota bacterium]
MLERVADLYARFEELTRLLGDPDVLADHRRMQEILQERSQLDPIVAIYQEYVAAREGLDEARSMANDADTAVREMAHDEAVQLEADMVRLEQELKVALLPRDPADERNVIVEIRAGTGGDEAGLFASDLFGMYQRYAERRGWKVDIMGSSANEAGGYREIAFELRGDGAYSRLKYESGVHRVQRVPATEQQGRIHTSTATVAVMPEAEEVEVHIDEK